MSNKYDLHGTRFGRLLVIEESGRKHKEIVWKCKCDCGKYADVTSSNLRSGHTKSCGCLQIDRTKASNTKHGLYGSPIHRTYYNMKNRCYNPHYHLFFHYGGKGITVCDEWLGEKGLENFTEWSKSHGYSPYLSIDRIDNSKGYSPSNCRWVDMKAQQNNRTNNHIINISGISRTLKQWSEICKIPYFRLLNISRKRGDARVAEEIQKCIQST